MLIPCFAMLINRDFNYPNYKGPWTLFNGDPSSDIMISWESERQTYPAVRYGTVKGSLTNLYYNDTLSKLHHLSLAGLDPNSKYYYQIGYFEELPIIPAEFIVERNAIFEFRTAPDNQITEFNFTAISDTQQLGLGSGYTKKVANKLATLAADTSFITIVGDITENNLRQSYWDNWFADAAGYLGKTVFLPVIGNHDLNLANVQPTPKPVDMINYFPISVSPNFFYYSFNYSMVHFVVSQFTWPEDSEVGDEQMDWLEQDLINNQEMSFIIMLFHCPIHDSGAFGENNILQTDLRPLLDYYNVSLILNGHDHHYERVEEFDLTYVVLGGGGAMSDPVLVPIPESKIIEFGPNYLQVSVNATHITGRAWSTEDILIDHFVIPARNGGG